MGWFPPTPYFVATSVTKEKGFMTLTVEIHIIEHPEAACVPQPRVEGGRQALRLPVLPRKVLQVSIS